MEFLKKTGLFDKVGAQHFYEHTGEAIDYALLQLDFNKCLGCKHFAFRECATLSRGEDNQLSTEKLKAEKPDSLHLVPGLTLTGE
ncbi:hypothetical protein D3C71_1689340 [compost metagenome]